MTKTRDTHEIVIKGKDAFGKVFNKLHGKISSVTGALGSMQAGIGAVIGVAGIGALISRSLETNDVLAKTADRLNISTEALAGLRHGAELTGTSAQALDMGLQRMVRRLGQVAATGGGEAKIALDQLGISIDDLRDKKPEEQFKLIAENMKGVADQGEKVFITQKLFDSEGVKLLNLLEQGADGIQAMSDEADALGLAISRVDAAKIEAANDSMLRVKRRIDGLGTQVTVSLAPLIEEVSGRFIDAAGHADDMSETVEDVMTGGARFVGVFLDGIHGIEVGIKLGETAAKGFGTGYFTMVNGVIDATFSVGNAIKDYMLFPLKTVLGLAAPFNDFAKESLSEINEWEFAPPEVLNGTMGEMVREFEETKAELQSLLMETLPSEELLVTVNNILAGAEERAQAIVADLQNKVGGVDDDDGTGLSEAEQAKITARLEKLDETYLTEYQMLQKKYDDEKALLQSALEAELILELEFDKKHIRAEQKFNKAKAALDKKAQDAKRAITIGGLEQIAGIFAGKSKAMFRVQQLAALAQAAVALPAAVIESFRNAGGYPWGVIPAGLMAAEGASQIASIKSQSFGGGGSTRGVSGGGGIPSAQIPSISNLNNGGIVPDETDDLVAARTVNFYFSDGASIGNDGEKTLQDIKRLIIEEDFELIPADSRNGIDLAQAVSTVG